MNTFSKRATALLLATTALTLYTTSPMAQERRGFDGFHISAGLGLSLSDDVVDPYVGSLSFHPGIRADFSIGYAFKVSDQVSIGPDLDVGVIYNEMDTFTEYGVGSGSLSGHLVQIPILANVVLNWQMSPRWFGYVGVGLGMDHYSVQDSDNVEVFSESRFAWQAQTGLRFRIGSGLLDFGYKYLSITPTGAQRLGNNSLLASYTWQFR
jgi:opacity protein-like surface antigen